MFRNELSDLKDRYLDRLNLIHVLESGTRDSEVLSGMIDDDTCDALFGSLVDVGAADMAFVLRSATDDGDDFARPSASRDATRPDRDGAVSQRSAGPARTRRRADTIAAQGWDDRGLGDHRRVVRARSACPRVRPSLPLRSRMGLMPLTPVGQESVRPVAAEFSRERSR